MPRKASDSSARIERLLKSYTSEDRGHGTPCWIIKPGAHHYSSVYLGAGETASAHRFFYATLIGPIPKGLQLDHLCRVRSCVNPVHMEPVTPSVNCLRALPFRRKRIPAKRTTCKTIGVVHNPEELAALEWLAKETMRKPGPTMKWAVAKVAKEMGYKPEIKESTPKKKQ